MKQENIQQSRKGSSIDSETSQRITALRFLLAVLVVFIHNNITAESINELYETEGILRPFCQSAAGKWMQMFISDGIARCAVPLFFLFASYLQFEKNDSYGTLLRKKAKSLAVPYFLWPVLNIALYMGLKLLASRIVPGLMARPGVIPQLEWTAQDWLHAFFGYEDMTRGRVFGGYVVQMWFVRDLFILIVFSPFIRFAARKFPVCTLLAVSFFYFCDVRPLIVAEQALFYYTLGFFWAEYDVPLFSFADRIQWKALLPLYLALFCAVWLFFGEYSCGYWFMVFVSCFVMLKCSALIVQHKKTFAVARYFAGFSFYLFAVHQPFLLGSIQSLWHKMLPLTSPGRCIAEYVCGTALVVALGTGSGIVLKKIRPRAFRLLNGGRS